MGGRIMSSFCSGLTMLASMLLLTISMRAQSEGNNAIYPTATATTAVASSNYIDASPFYASTGDLCVTIFNILNCTATSGCSGGYSKYPSTGAVIDARGILTSSGAITCSMNPFPSSLSGPTTVLLPGANISISAPWVLPSNTRIIGEGSSTTNYTAGSWRFGPVQPRAM